MRSSSELSSVDPTSVVLGKYSYPCTGAPQYYQAVKQDVSVSTNKKLESTVAESIDSLSFAEEDTMFFSFFL